MKTRNKRQNKKAISLIVLVITIIVMTILAGAIVLTLNNSGIIEKANEAVETANEATVRQLAQLKWAEAYLDETIQTDAQYSEYVIGQLKEELGDNIASSYIIEVTAKGVTVNQKSQWIAEIVDGVPIPKGFAASPYGADEEKGIPAENKRASGLVIYELEAGETDLSKDKDAHESRTTRNQYVWVPVADLSTKKFERVDWKNAGKISNVIGVGVWEATPGLDLTDTNISAYVSPETLKEVTEMYDSVATYGGFYIARYEAGLGIDADGKIIKGNDISSTTVYSMMNKAPYNLRGWSDSESMTVETGGVVQLARSMYKKENANYGVVSTLTYGVQWDAVVQWMQDKGINVLDSTEYGNYMDNEISTFNEGTQRSTGSGDAYTPIADGYLKTNTQSTLFTTGATNEARVNNIYDMAGNLCEWTMEGDGNGLRSVRGGGYDIASGGGSYLPVCGRSSMIIDHYPYFCGFRPALYIKK